MDAKRYFLSMCICNQRVRVHMPGRTPDYCESCGGWLPPLPDLETAEREQRTVQWWYFVLGLLALGAGIAGVWLR